MFYLNFLWSELRRRSGRTILTALGLAVGVGLVVTVNALSTGLDRAQSKVLKPLTGVGTDLSVSRPLKVSGGGRDFTPGGPGGPGGPGALSPSDRERLRQENGGARIGLRDLGKPGERFERDRFTSGTQLSFPASDVASVAKLRGASAAAGALTLTNVHISGTVPQTPPGGGGGGGGVFRGGGGGGGGGGPGEGGPPRDINATSSSISGVDERYPQLGAVSPGQLTTGRYFSTTGNPREAILTVDYAQQKGLAVGSTVKLGGKDFTVIGLAKPPLGGQAADVYVKLAELQRLSGRAGRVNSIRVRAASTGQVDSLTKSIERSFAGAQVTTSKDLAKRVGGSLKDAKDLSNSLGTALVIVGLAAAFLIASLLTLSSVTKRTRELGTLKALGWPQRLVVRQVTGESLAQGVFGGVLGVALGVAGAALLSALSPTLEATVASNAPSAPAGGPPGPLAAAFGQGQITSGSTNVALDAPVDAGLILLAVALALAGGLIAGAVGSLRSARLRPADALRHIE